MITHPAESYDAESREGTGRDCDDETQCYNPDHDGRVHVVLHRAGHVHDVWQTASPAGW